MIESTLPVAPTEEVSKSASQEALLPGAYSLTGNRFLSSQAIFDIFSVPDIAERAIKRLPSGPKSNCDFILNLGKELTEYTSASMNRMKIQDHLRDGTGGWADQCVNNSCCYLVENGTLKNVIMNKKKTGQLPHFDLRAHRATYQANNPDGIPSRKLVCWFWNSDFSPAPGMAIVAYLGPAYTPRPHGNSKHTSSTYERVSHESIASYGRKKKSTMSDFKNETFCAEENNRTPPRNRQQIANAKYYQRKTSGISDCVKPRNFATVCSI